jgi:hypothetical protein
VGSTEIIRLDISCVPTEFETDPTLSSNSSPAGNDSVMLPEPEDGDVPPIAVLTVVSDIVTLDNI